MSFDSIVILDNKCLLQYCVLWFNFASVAILHHAPKCQQLIFKDFFLLPLIFLVLVNVVTSGILMPIHVFDNQ